MNGQISVIGDFIVIARKGFMAKMSQGFTKGEKRLNIHTITAVQLKKPGMTRGYIQFSLGGGNESRKGVSDATKDENSVLFDKKSLAEFEALRDYIEHRIAEAHAPQGPSLSQEPDLGEQIRKLAALRDEGILSDDEFQAKKADLLSRM
ncbi:MAG TPA: DUF4429 domain-containing protein [Actinomycetota bacterium]